MTIHMKSETSSLSTVKAPEGATIETNVIILIFTALEETGMYLSSKHSAQNILIRIRRQLA